MAQIVALNRRPGAKAPLSLWGLFAGLKPCAPSETQRQRYFEHLLKLQGSES
jgi:hypothetical protein